jgi:membrane protease YdiL (CAAX protease family)
MNNSRQKNALVWFVVLTFAMTWTFWGTIYCLNEIIPTPGIYAILIGLGMWGPGLAAILVTRFVLGESLGTTTINRLGRLRYYLWAWSLPIAGTIAVTLLTFLFGIARFDPALTFLRDRLQASGAQLPGFLTPQVIFFIGTISALTLAPLINSVFALGEELGWRGFLLPRLIQAGMGQWKALLLSGMIWGIWHAPIIVQGHNYPAHPYLGVLLMTVFCMLLGIIFGWLQLAGGSVWAPTLAHGTINAVAGLPLVISTPCDLAVGGALSSVIGWIPLALFIAWLAWSGRLPVPIHEQ